MISCAASSIRPKRRFRGSGFGLSGSSVIESVLSPKPQQVVACHRDQESGLKGDEQQQERCQDSGAGEADLLDRAEAEGGDDDEPAGECE